MSEYPTWESKWNVMKIDAPDFSGVAVVSEYETEFIEGDIIREISGLITGEKCRWEIVKEAPDKYSEKEIEEALDFLKVNSYLRIVDDVKERVPGILEERKSNKLESISFYNLSSIPSEQLNNFSLEYGIELLPADKQSSNNLLIIVDDYLSDELDELAGELQGSNKTWYLCKPTGQWLWFGPLFKRESDSCWHCFKNSLERNSLFKRYLKNKNNEDNWPEFSINCSDFSIRFALNQVFMQVAEAFEEGVISKFKTLRTFNLKNFNWKEHRFISELGCKVCNSGKFYKKTRFNSDELFNFNAYRGFKNSYIYEKNSGLISSLTGVVSHLEKASEPQMPVSCYEGKVILETREPRTIEELDEQQAVVRGKGLSSASAQVSCLGEALEVFTGRASSDEQFKTAPYNELENAIHPNDCMLFSDRQYENREEINATASPNQVPPSLSDEEVIKWDRVWSLTEEKTKFIPAGYLYFNISLSACQWESNGCASGNSFPEAFCSALLELIERDAVAIWHYNELHRRRVDLESFNQLPVERIANYFSQRKRELWVLDVTSDLQVPVFVALLRNNSSENAEILMGFGAHFDPRRALRDAVLEVAQVYSARSHLWNHPYGKKWLEEVTLTNQPHLAPGSVGEPKKIQDYSYRNLKDKKKVEKLVGKLEEKGLEVLIHNQSHPEANLKTMRVIVPGLRPHWPRFAPGRLYKVPVELGLEEQKTKEKELNRWELFT